MLIRVLFNLSIFFDEVNLSEVLVLTKIDRQKHTAAADITRVNFILKKTFSVLN